MAERNIEIGELVRVVCSDTSPWSWQDSTAVCLVIGKETRTMTTGKSFAVLLVHCLYGSLGGWKERIVSQHWFEVISEDQ